MRGVAAPATFARKLQLMLLLLLLFVVVVVVRTYDVAVVWLCCSVIVFVYVPQDRTRNCERALLSDQSSSKSYSENKKHLAF